MFVCREDFVADGEMQINESGLKIFSIEDLQSAAEKSVQFSKVVKMGESLRTLTIPDNRMLMHVSSEGY